MHVLRRRIDEEHSIAALGRESRKERVLGDDQVALQNGIGHGADEPYFERASALVGVIQCVADFFSHRPDDGCFVPNGRNCIVDNGGCFD